MKLGKVKTIFRRWTAAVTALSVVGAPAFANARATKFPIEHVVVIFQENVSFDHYFATYPQAANTDGSAFYPAENTPTVNGLGTLVEGEPSGVLLTNNPNFKNASNTPPTNPFRLSHSEASTCDQDHNYGDEQEAFDMGLMDLFPLATGAGESTFCLANYAYGKGKGLVMGYFDGNTVTAMWNYAQNFAISDNFFGTTFGPSTPGALNVVSGNTFPVTQTNGTSSKVVTNADGGTTVGDLDPTGDVCSSKTATTIQIIQMGSPSVSPNIGDLLSAQGLTWGSFMGGFDLKVTNPNGTTGCSRSSTATPANYTASFPADQSNNFTADYIPHHAWFQYFPSTANPMHTRPSVPPSQYGSNADAANHEYDIHDFFDALNADNLPAVSYLKAPANMDGHAGYSDPLMEQQFVVTVVNAIEQSELWKSTAVFITYDDSDGWYDHQMNPIVNPSAQSNPSPNGDQLNGPGKCGNGTPLTDDNGNAIQGRCGYGPRLPLLVISPFAKQNFVDHGLSDQSSIVRFIEDNWGFGRIGNGSFDALAGPFDNLFDFDKHDLKNRRLILDPTTGESL